MYGYYGNQKSNSSGGTPALAVVVYGLNVQSNFDAQTLSFSDGDPVSNVTFSTGTDATTRAGKSDATYTASGINGFPSLETTFAKQFEFPFDFTGTPYMVATVMRIDGNRSNSLAIQYEAGDAKVRHGGFSSGILNAANHGYSKNDASGSASVPTQISALGQIDTMLLVSRLMADGELRSYIRSLDGGGESIQQPLSAVFDDYKFLSSGIAFSGATQLNAPEVVFQIGEIVTSNEEVSDAQVSVFSDLMLAKWGV